MSLLPSDPDFDPAAFDGRLRDAYDADDAAGAGAPPPMRAWAGLQGHLIAPVRPAVRHPALLGGAAGLVVGLLLMWGWGVSKTGSDRTTVANPLRAVVNPLRVVGTPPGVVETPLRALEKPLRAVDKPLRVVVEPLRVVGKPLRTVDKPLQLVGKPLQLVGKPLQLGGKLLQLEGNVLPAVGSAIPTLGNAIPVVVNPVLLPLIQTETTYAALSALDSAAETHAARRRALLAERGALTTLTRRTDSLLLTLGALPEVPPALAADTTQPPNHLTTQNRWSVAVSFAPERNFFGLQSAPTDTLSALRRTHEQGRAGYSAQVQAEYRLTSRWSVGAGLGVTSTGAELRLTDRQTLISVAYDTTSTHTVQTTHVDNLTYSIRIVQDPVLSPVFNLNQQIIGYDTVYVPRPDTVWTRVITNGTVATNTFTSTPTITRRQETSSRILRPNYRFLTVPLLVRYRLGTEGGQFGGPASSRWWADVALGAQLQFFLGGTQLTSADGRQWQTQRVGPGQGPFRPFTVALTGAVALNYALTPRLSASVAPTLRYQTESVYKASTGLTQRPAASGVMMGLRLAF